MLQNYFKIALRNLLKHKVFSLINIFGLSIGIACCLLLSLYIQDEFSYDKHHVQKENLYRIVTKFEGKMGLDKLPTASPPIALAMQDEIEDITAATRVLNPPDVQLNLIKHEDNVFYEEHGLLADSTLFKIFNYHLLEGNPEDALTEPNSVVLSERMARKLFGSEPAINKVIFISQGVPSGDFKVTGVFHQPGKSHLEANFFISMTSGGGWASYLRSDDAQGEWAGQNFVPSYVRLIPGHDRVAVVDRMNQVLVKYGAEDMKALGIAKTLDLEPVQEIYLRSDIGQNPRITNVYAISTIAIFILLIACINFMNLSTAKATKRANEIGVRKVLGALRSSLIRQLLGEAMLLVVISIIISIAIIYLALPYFNTLADKHILFDSDNILYFGTAVIGITLLTGLIAGCYPAFYLSSFQPAEVLKSRFKLNSTSGSLRQALVVFQFVIGIALVCGMMIIGQQLRYMQNKSLGFNPDAKIVLPLRTEFSQKGFEAFKQEVSREAGIKGVAAADFMPGSNIWNDFPLYAQGGNMDLAKLHRVNTVDPEYIDLIGLKIIAGRPFTPTERNGDHKIVVNRIGISELGFTPEEAIGQQVFTELQGEKIPYEIIGVMEDYHQISLKEKIYPTIFRMKSEGRTFDYAIINIEKENLGEVLSVVENTWNKVVKDTPFEYSFLDDTIQKQYSEDRKASTIITSFTAIAMIISCLGLYGLSSYMAERRVKEIGIRKVLGANVSEIVNLMSREFIRLISIAFVLAVPLSWYVMNQWLADFAYRIEIDIMVFVMAGSAAMAIALVTVGFESVKAATGDPVKSLMSE